MTKPMYSVEAVPSKTLLLINLSGFFSDIEVLGFRCELRAVIRSHSWGYGRHTVLCDITNMSIQPQSIVELFAEVVNDPALRSKRLAFLVGSSLARMQAQRLTMRENVAFFGDREKAQAWLDNHTKSG